MTPQEFKLFVKLYRKQHTKAWRLKNQNPRLPRMLYPHAIEEVYAGEISKVQQRLVDYAIGRLQAILPKLYRKDDLRSDAETDELEALLKELEAELLLIYGTNLVSSGNLGQILFHTAEKIFGFEAMQYLKITKVVAGIPLQMSGAAWWPEMRASWEATNYRLIRNLSAEYVTKLNTMLLTGFQGGWSQQEMSEAIQGLSDKITSSRANLIARDQTSKLTSFISRAQDESMGVDSYLWQAARDEKVRGNPLGIYPRAVPSHWIIDFMVCRWSNSTIYSSDGGKIWQPRTSMMPKVAPGIEILCFPGDTLVQCFTQAEILYRRRYKGRITVLNTVDGLTIRCTPNHPIMRADGQMIPAHLLNKGDAIVKIVRKQPTVGESEIYDGVATFDKAFNFCSIMFGSTFANTTTRDFHGDGGEQEQVDIIPINGILGTDIIAKLNQPFLDHIFSEALMCLSDIPCSADASSSLFALGFASDTIVSLLSKLYTLFFSHTTHSDDIRLTTASKLYSIFKQSCGNGCPGDVVFFREGEDRSPIEILTDYFFYRQLALVWRHSDMQGTLDSELSEYLSNVGFAKSGDTMNAHNAITFERQTVDIVDNILTVDDTHVYNLQVPSSKYSVSQEKILVNNCRCLASPYFVSFLAEIDKEIEEEP